MQALFFLNGLGLFIVGILFGWVWFFQLLGEIVIWPLPVQIDVEIPGDSRAYRMGRMEAITQALLLMALAFGGQFMRLSRKQCSALFWSAVVTTWANDIICLCGWPPIVAVHVLFALATVGVFRFLRQQKTQNSGSE